MSLNLNKVVFAGNLTKDPEMKTTTTGKSVCSFSIASNKTWKNANGEKQEDTTFMNCTAWDKLADFIATYFKKGDPIYTEGSIKNRSWDKPDGTKGYATDINVQIAQFVVSKKGENPTVDGLKEAGMIPEQGVDTSGLPF